MKTYEVDLGTDEDGDSITVTETGDVLRIETPGWFMPETCPIKMEIENWAVDEFGGKENVIDAFRAFVRALDSSVQQSAA